MKKTTFLTSKSTIFRRRKECISMNGHIKLNTRSLTINSWALIYFVNSFHPYIFIKNLYSWPTDTVKDKIISYASRENH